MPRTPTRGGRINKSVSIPRDLESVVELIEEHWESFSAFVADAVETYGRVLGHAHDASIMRALGEDLLRESVERDRLRERAAALSREIKEARLEDMVHRREQETATSAHAQKFRSPDELVRYARSSTIGSDRLRRMATANGWDHRAMRAAEERIAREERASAAARHTHPTFTDPNEFVSYWRARIPDTDTAWREIAALEHHDPATILAAARRAPTQTWLPTRQDGAP